MNPFIQRLEEARKKANNGTILSRDKFYQRCSEAEAKMLGKVGDHFPSCGEKTARRRVDAIINGEHIPDAGAVNIMEAVLRLPLGTLQNLITVGVSTTRRERLDGINNPRTDMETLDTRLEGIEDIHATINSLKRVRVVTIEGEATTGKSQMIAYWYKIYGAQSGRPLFSLNCEGHQSEVISRELNDFFGLSGGEPFSKNLAHAISTYENPIIVLDGLNVADVDRNYDQEEILLTNHSAVLAHITELIRELVEIKAECSIILGIQTAYGESDTLELPMLESAAHTYRKISVQRLSTQEGANLFEKLGVKQINRSDLERLSEQLLGMPMSIDAATRLLIKESPEERARLVMQLDSGLATASNFKEVFWGIIKVMERHAPDTGRYPLAFIRLLSLFPGRVSGERLLELLESGQVERLRPDDIEYFSRRLIPYVEYDSAQNLYSVHQFARRLILDQLLTVGKPSEVQNTSLEELQWISLCAAINSLAKLPNEVNSSVAPQIQLIEDAIAHFMFLRELLPIVDTLDRNSLPKFESENTPLSFDIKKDWSAKSLTKFCFDKVLKTYLLDRGKHFTRSLGQFERKASILVRLLTSYGSVNVDECLSSKDANKLHVEAAVCFMHAGRLRLAIKESALALTTAEKGFEKKPSSYSIEELIDSPSLAESWASYIGQSSMHSLILSRQGRTANISRAPLRSFQKAVVAEDLDTFMNTDFTRPENYSRRLIFIGMRRALSRWAYFDLLEGKMRAARAGFDLVDRMESYVSNTGLQGDAARRHAETLIRSGRNDYKLMDKAHDIIMRCLSYNSAKPSDRRTSDNDLIGYLVLHAKFLRIANRPEEARQVLEKAEGLENVSRGQCPHSYLQEFDLERLKFRASYGTNDERRDLLNDVIVFRRRQLLQHHGQLYTEAGILEASLLSGKRQAELLSVLEMQVSSSQWSLWLDGIHDVRDNIGIEKIF